MSVELLCTVRGCGGRLDAFESRVVCWRGHSFDRARSGYVNLLQPQDRRSRTPGDSKEAAAARRRLLDAGHETPILVAIVAAVRDAGIVAGATALDVGCGEGHFLDRLASEALVSGVGLDISVPSVDLAARAHPELTWVVANADRFLPFADGSFDVVTSITSRRNATEMHRVGRAGSKLVVVVPGPDDLGELRERLHGVATAQSRAARAAEALAPQFALRRREVARAVARLDAAGVADLLAVTYRGGRRSERERVDGLTSLDVTLSREILVFDRV